MKPQELGRSTRWMVERFSCWLLIAAATLGAAGAQQANSSSLNSSTPLAVQLPAAHDDLAFARAAHLRRGINLSMWYAQSSDYSAQALASNTTAADFKLIHELGFDHVRLSINPVPLLADEAKGTLKPDALARLADTVQQITANGLIVVLDIHPEDGWKHVVTLSEEGAGEFFLFWTNFAHSFAATDPQKVYFEVLNEPEGVDAYRWAGVQARAIAAIRSQVPQHTIIATGASFGSIDGLLAIEPVRDENVIYSFHDYEPMAFTHQGATWAGDALINLRNVPYPSSPEAVHPLMYAQRDDTARSILAQYGHDRWTIDTMAKRIDLAVQWAAQRHVPLWCGEFGVYKAFAPPADRARWISDMRTTLEKDGIGWDMWDYQGSFALVSKKDGVPTADPAIVTALGLIAPKP
jgi:endoglucanase